MRIVNRRDLGKLTLGATGLAVLGREQDAHAGPLFWAAARWAAEGIASWVLAKALDEAYDHLKGFKVEEDRDKVRVERAPETVVRLGNRVEARRAEEPFQTIDNCLFAAFRRNGIPFEQAFAYWGRPSSPWTVRQLDDGFLIAQWWTPYNSDRRYVVTRTYNRGTAFHYLAFRERSGASKVAEEVVNGAEPSRPRMKVLVHEPRNFEHDPKEDPPGPS